MLSETNTMVKIEPNCGMPTITPKTEPIGSHENNNHCLGHSNSNNCDVTTVSCEGCGGSIGDRFYLKAVEKEWHAQCLRCCECKCTLDSDTTCFARDGNVYCKEDYYRRFAMKKCARCQLDISSNELVMKARQFVYHIHCFSCASCHKILSTGEYFGMRNETLFCKTHYEQNNPDLPTPPSPDFLKHPDFLDFQHRPTGNHPAAMMDPSLPGLQMNPHVHGMPLPVGGGGGHLGPHGHPAQPTHFYNGVGSTQKGRPRKRKNQHNDMGLICGDSDEMTMTSDGMMLTSTRQKRIRTSFKHQQLRVLKSYFALNQNPDAKDLKQLSQKTGLAKRVLQVWFQNARAKYRRNMLKQNSDGSTSNGNNKNSTSSSENTEFSPNNNNNQSMDSSEFPDIPDMRNAHSPTAMSDLSSTPSLNDLHPGVQIGREATETGSSNFTDLFSHVTSNMNGFL